MADETSLEVQVVRKRGQSALVQWADAGGQLHRAYVPTGAIDEDGNVPESVLEMGIPHGIPWSEVLSPSATPESVEAELHRAGIWTAEDLRNNPQAAVGALQAAYGVDLAALNAAARKFNE